jgi:hypothetical protein
MISNRFRLISNRCRRTSFGPFTKLSARHWLAESKPKQRGLINDCASSAWGLCLTMLRRRVTRGALTRRCFRNIGIPRSRPRLGQAAGRSHAGSPHSLSRGNGSTIFGSISDGVSGFQVQAGNARTFFLQHDTGIVQIGKHYAKFITETMRQTTMRVRDSCTMSRLHRPPTMLFRCRRADRGPGGPSPDFDTPDWLSSDDAFEFFLKAARG